MKGLDIIKIDNKMRELIGSRCLNYESEYDGNYVNVSFSLSDIVMPKNNPKYFGINNLDNIRKEFNCDDILIQLGSYKMHIKMYINNANYFL
jgi:hypothetical protein